MNDKELYLKVNDVTLRVDHLINAIDRNIVSPELRSLVSPIVVELGQILTILLSVGIPENERPN